jgi:hypothetical protein
MCLYISIAIAFNIAYRGIYSVGYISVYKTIYYTNKELCMSNKEVMDLVREALREEDNDILNAIFHLEAEQDNVPEEMHDVYRMAINQLYNIGENHEKSLTSHLMWEMEVDYILPIGDSDGRKGIYVPRVLAN